MGEKLLGIQADPVEHEVDDLEVREGARREQNELEIVSQLCQHLLEARPKGDCHEHVVAQVGQDIRFER